MFSMSREAENIFEQKRKNDAIQWKEISFISNSVLKRLNIIRKKDGFLSEKDKEKLDTVLLFNTKGAKINHLRVEATDGHVSKEESTFLRDNLINGTIIPLEKIKDKNNITFFNKAKNINLSGYSSLYEYFARGKNIGTCGYTSELVGILYDDIFKDVELHKGILPIITGTKGAANGNHAWIEVTYNEKRYIIDTSLLTAIPLELKGKIGYEDKKSIKLDEEMKSLKTKSISLTSSEEDMLEASENKGKSTEGKYSYSNFLEYQKEIDKEEIEI